MALLARPVFCLRNNAKCPLAAFQTPGLNPPVVWLIPSRIEATELLTQGSQGGLIMLLEFGKRSGRSAHGWFQGMGQ